MIPFPRTMIIGIAAVLLLTLSSCTDDKPKPIPDVPTEAPTVSPPPEAPDLSSEEKKAFDDAVSDYAEGQEIVDRVAKNHKAGAEDLKDLKKMAYSPAINEIAREIDKRAKNGVRTTGSRKIAWQVPLKVDLESKIPTITWLQCNTPGDLKVTQNGKTVPQKNTNPLLKITSNPDAKSSDPAKWFWKISMVKETTC